MAVRRLPALITKRPSIDGLCPSNRAGAQVRQILGRPGEVWAPESGTDRLVVIRTTGE